MDNIVQIEIMRTQWYLYFTFKDAIDVKYNLRGREYSRSPGWTTRATLKRLENLSRSAGYRTSIKFDDDNPIITIERVIPSEAVNIWSDDDTYPRSDWQYEVTSGATNLGYWEWVAVQKEIEEG